MGNRQPLSTAEKERIYQGRLAGQRMRALASELGCSVHCVPKWWQLGHQQGLARLQAARQPRGASGVLSHFAPQVAQTALTLKRAHPGWGPNRVFAGTGG